MRRIAARRDFNHGAIVDAFKSMGAMVYDASADGGGMSDLVIAWRGHFLLVEIKDGAKSPSRRKLTPAQIIFHGEAAMRGCKVHIVTNVDEALALLGARRAA